MSRQRTLEQERAEKAWECISQVKQLPEKVQKEYKSLAHKAPADIQTNGLGQTAAFWHAKGYENSRPKDDGNTADYQILKHVTSWLNTNEIVKVGKPNLVEWISKDAKTNDYRRATAETIAFLVWLKRFAEAELP